MKKAELLELGLPKWPAIIIRGKSVTKEQAQEIIIRTDDLNFCSNDQKFENQLYKEIYGVEGTLFTIEEELAKKHNIDKNQYTVMRELKHKFIAPYKLLPIHYLQNHRILSSWIGGPHGWCNWNGYIGTNNYNIGKYPSVSEVYKEWKIIAKEFPFLDLRCQLMDGEAGEDKDISPVVEFVVSNGKVRIKKPKDFIDYTNVDFHQIVLKNLMNPGRERGCTLEDFKNALQHVKVKYREDEAYLKEVKEYTKHK